MPDGGKLCFKTSSQLTEGMARLTIADSGVGIPMDLIPKVFKPFYTTKAKGAGLGLAIVEKIIQEHGGKIKIFSESGKGTIVEVNLLASKE